MDEEILNVPEIDENDPFLLDVEAETLYTEPPNFTEQQESEKIEEQKKEDDPEPVQSVPFSVYKTSAEGIVITLDSLAQGFLPNSYKRVFFSGREEMQSAKSAFLKKDRSTEELELAEKYEAWQNQCENVPMTRPTKEAIIQPLAEVLQKQGTVITPENRLLLAVAGYAAPLILPFFIRKN